MEVKIKSAYSQHSPESLWEIFSVREELDGIPTVIENQPLFQLIKLLVKKGVITEQEVFENLTDFTTRSLYEEVKER